MPGSRSVTATLILVLLLFLTALAPVAQAAPSPEPDADAKIESDLAATLAEKDSADFYVEFTDRADLTAAAAVTGWAERGAAVVRELRTTAEASQADLNKELDEARIDHTNFWITNAILVHGGTRELADGIAEHDEVAALTAPDVYQIPEPTPGEVDPTVNAVEWGIDRIRADDVWSTFGVRGEGIVVGSIDTGVDFRHPALVRQYRGNTGNAFSHDYNWFDPARVCALPEPCDNNEHGTHTMGTMVGSDGANQIGVAPGARWITAKGCETNTCTTSSLLASGQWMLAPTRLDGTGADASRRPHIINNSWGGAGGATWYADTIRAWRAAGMFPAFSVGNSGPACGTAGSPGDDEQAYASGYFDVNNAIASLSSRGPGPAGRIKPDVAAPGVNVRSSVPGGGYASLSGSSMASPHTAGTVALMWAAAPSLVGDVTGTISLLDRTALDTPDTGCGGNAENNNVWGEGRLDALAAVTAAPRASVGTVAGTVSDAATGLPISGAQVSADGPFDRSAVSGPDGAFTMIVPPGSYTVSASAYGFRTGSEQVTVIADQTVRQDLVLSASPTGIVTVTVTGAPGPVADATVTIEGTPLPPGTTDQDGRYTFGAVPFGSYRVSVTAGNCFTATSVDLTVDGDEAITVSVPQVSDGYGYTCRIEGADYQPADTPLPLTGDDAAIAVDLPFPFFFYGANYSRAWVSTNGHLNFLASSTALTNTTIPNASAPNAAIYPFWDDLYFLPTSQALTGTSGTAPNRSFMIEWRGVTFFTSTDRSLSVDFQVQLNEDGSIVLRYRNLGPAPRERGDSATVGIENATGTVALQYSSNTPVLSDDRSIRFVPPPNGFVTGTVTDANDQRPIEGATLTARQGATVIGTTNSAADGRFSLRLKVGSYTVEAAKLNYLTQQRAVELTAGGESVQLDAALATAVADLNTAALWFLGNEGQLRTQRVTLSNPSTSGVTLTYSLAVNQGWLWTVPASGAVPPGGSRTLTVRVDAAGLPTGVVHTGSIAFTTNAGRAPAPQIPVTLVVPGYRQGLRSGSDTPYVDSFDDPWAADKAWTPGDFGYLGAGWINNSSQPIAGTDDDALYRTQREASSGYRFDDLPAGTYLVELNFVEFRKSLAAGRRVFDVSINGSRVLDDYDPVAAVGTLTLDHREFTATVAAGGAIAVDFGAQRGKLPPIVNAVRVTHRPDLVPDVG